MLALAAAVREGRIKNASIAIVISDKSAAAGLVSARELGLTTAVVARRGRSREDHDAETVSMLRYHEVDLVCLAGYMRVLSSDFLSSFPRRILNIHPSLLPAFPGMNAQLQAIEHGVKYTGCTVHFVDETLDGGPIVAQKVVQLSDEDTEESLAARILEQEHQLYPQAVDFVINGKYEVVGRRVLRSHV
jgi:phosphoribosylglycinamide formyltransferase-1